MSLCLCLGTSKGLGEKWILLWLSLRFWSSDPASVQISKLLNYLVGLISKNCWFFPIFFNNNLQEFPKPTSLNHLTIPTLPFITLLTQKLTNILTHFSLFTPFIRIHLDPKYLRYNHPSHYNRYIFLILRHKIAKLCIHFITY